MLKPESFLDKNELRICMSDYSESEISSSEKAPTTKTKTRTNFKELSEI